MDYESNPTPDVVSVLLEKIREVDCLKDGTYNEKLLQYLVMLNYMFPQRFLDALDILEEQRCIICTDRYSRKLVVVDGVPIDLNRRICSCSDFLRRVMCDNPPSTAKWLPVCKHLLAGILASYNFKFLPTPRSLRLTTREAGLLSLSDPQATAQVLTLACALNDEGKNE